MLKYLKKKKKRVTFPCVGKVIELYVEPSKCHFTDTLYFYVSCVHRHILKNQKITFTKYRLEDTFGLIEKFIGVFLQRFEQSRFNVELFFFLNVIHLSN